MKHCPRAVSIARPSTLQPTALPSELAAAPMYRRFLTCLFKCHTHPLLGLVAQQLDLGERTLSFLHQLTLKVLNFWKFTSYCSLKPLWSGMGEVVPARTSPTLHPPSPPTVHQLSQLALWELMTTNSLRVCMAYRLCFCHTMLCNHKLKCNVSGKYPMINMWHLHHTHTSQICVFRHHKSVSLPVSSWNQRSIKSESIISA